ncbi:RICIN domain-containing protein [Streptomyces cyaneofuscatus]|uniref:RICIN domain-containing protein n=1 Tax=Streptomyces cyaneofuscatus TaxID=66883 RepID=UPI003435277B
MAVALVAGASALAGLGSSGAWAGEPAPSGIVTLKNDATANCVDHDPGWSGVITRNCNGGNNQRFEVLPGRTEGYFLLKNLATGNCLDNDTYQGHIMARGCNVSNGHQNWAQEGRIIRNYQTGACLDDDPSHRYLMARGCNGGGNQNWEWVK